MESKVLSRVIVSIALVLSVINMVLLLSLLDARRQISAAAGEAASALQNVQSKTLASPLTVNVAVDNTFTVPLKASIPVKTTVNVPIVLPILGQSVTVAVPIDTVVPINTTVRIPIQMSVPVHISISDLLPGVDLQQVQDWLVRLANTH